MGVKTQAVTSYTCDLCGGAATEDSSNVYVECEGPARDVGPSYIAGRLTITRPYVVDRGILCDGCKRRWLRQYLLLIQVIELE
jgi:DNA-directed RNA polymerase subunit RPC12/RpoP